MSKIGGQRERKDEKGIRGYEILGPKPNDSTQVVDEDARNDNHGTVRAGILTTGVLPPTGNSGQSHRRWRRWHRPELGA